MGRGSQRVLGRRGRARQRVCTQIKPSSTTPYTAYPAMESGGASPAGWGPAPGAGGRHGSGALGWLLDLSQSQSPSPRSLEPLSPGSPTTGAPRRTHLVPGEPCRVRTDAGLKAQALEELRAQGSRPKLEGRGGENLRAKRKWLLWAGLKVPAPTPGEPKCGPELNRRVQGQYLERLEVRAKLGLTDVLRSRS